MNEQATSPTQQATGIFLVVLSAVLTAVVPTSARLAYDAGATTLTVLSARGIIAVAVLSLAMLAMGQSFAMRRKALLACLFAGIAYQSGSPDLLHAPFASGADRTSAPD